MFEKIIEEESAKGAWNKLKNLYDEDEKLKRVKLQMLRKKLEKTKMKESESVSEFFTCVVLLMNQMNACGKWISNLQKIKKVLRSPTANFNYICRVY